MEWLTTELVLTVIAGIMGVISAGAALQSANSAKEAQKTLIEQQALAKRTEVVQLVAGCSYENERIVFVLKRLRTQIRHSAEASGGFGGSRQKIAEDTADGLALRAHHAYEDVSKLKSDATMIRLLKDDDVATLLFKLPLVLSELRAIGDDLLRESDVLNAQLLQYRERALNAGAPTTQAPMP